MATELKNKAVLLVRDPGGRLLCRNCLVAAGPLSRMRGLLGRRSLAADEGLLLRPASSIHTAFMRFAIDAVFLDREGAVLHVAHDLKPWRMAAMRRARTVLELPAGCTRGRGLEPGKKLTFVAQGDAAGAELDLDLPPRPTSEAELAGSAARQGR